MFASTLLAGQSVNLMIVQKIQAHEKVAKGIAEIQEELKKIELRAARDLTYTTEEQTAIDALTSRLDIAQKANLISINRLKASMDDDVEDDKTFSDKTISLDSSDAKDPFVSAVQRWALGAEGALTSAQINMLDVKGTEVEVSADDIWGGVKLAFAAVPYGGAISGAIDKVVAIGKAACAMKYGSGSQAPNVNHIKNALKEGYRKIGTDAADIIYPAFVKDWKKEKLIPDETNDVFKEEFLKDATKFSEKFMPKMPDIEKGFSKAIVDSLQDSDGLVDWDGDGAEAGYIDISYNAVIEWSSSSVDTLRAMNYSGKKVKDNIMGHALIMLTGRKITINDASAQVTEMLSETWGRTPIVDMPFKIRIKFHCSFQPGAIDQLEEIAGDGVFADDDDVEDKVDAYKSFIRQTSCIWRTERKPGNASFNFCGGHPVFHSLVTKGKIYRGISGSDIGG